MIRLFLSLLGLVVVASLASCGRQESAPVATTPLRQFEPASLARGAQLFGERCAQCHGPEGQGHPDWQRPSDGAFAAAPPLNGTGNDWKRSRKELAAVIKAGVRRKADKAVIMPPMQGKLNERDIEDILNWLQSLWPAEVYETWNKAQLATAQPSR
jgi:mono/diheme cytochrome c family protein